MCLGVFAGGEFVVVGSAVSIAGSCDGEVMGSGAVASGGSSNTEAEELGSSMVDLRNSISRMEGFRVASSSRRDSSISSADMVAMMLLTSFSMTSFSGSAPNVPGRAACAGADVGVCCDFGSS